MKKVLKIIITTVILAMFFYNASFAAGLGEKEGGAVVVAIYNNNTYVALNATTEALAKGQVLEWNKWSNEDLIILHDRCRKGDVNSNNRVKWYINYKEEFQKRIDNKQIIAAGNGNGKTVYSESTEYKVSTTDANGDVQKKTESSKINPNDYKPGSSDSTSNAEELGKIGNTIIGFIQGIGSIASVAVLGILGIKYMIGSAEERAEYKKSLRPYIIGAVMVFAITNLLGILAPIAKNLFGNI